MTFEEWLKDYRWKTDLENAGGRVQDVRAAWEAGWLAGFLSKDSDWTYYPTPSKFAEEPDIKRKEPSK